ncbi:MAG: hemerythrin domain-containing protein [Burkholderiaceae bacterium]|nr:hemerythrin domain-containing protein [Burkholderiaceae bacterium]
MNFQSQVSHALDEEHRTNLDLLGKVESAFARAPRSGASRNPDLVKVAAMFARHLQQDVHRHFDFEEQELFTRLTDAGEGDIAELMVEEHEAIRAVADEMLPLARAAAAGELDDEGWNRLKVGALEMVERQVSHIQKETMALLPVLEDLLDEDTDRELAFAYAAG